MGINLADLATNTAEVEVHYGDASFNVTFKPNLITTERLNKVDSGSTDGAEFFQFFVDVIEDWDISDGKKPVPVNEEGVAKIPIPILRTILQQMMEATTDPTAGKRSSGS